MVAFPCAHCGELVQIPDKTIIRFGIKCPTCDGLTVFRLQRPQPRRQQCPDCKLWMDAHEILNHGEGANLCGAKAQ